MIRLFARHPTAGNLLMMAFLALGWMALSGVRSETLPEVAPSKVEVAVVYAGASTADVEEAICRPLEEALIGVSFLEELVADAREGRGVVTATMVEGADFDTFRTDVQSEVDGLSTLPEAAEEPVVTALGLETPVLSLLVTGSSTPQGLKSYCEDLEARLRRLPEVSLVELKGFGDHQLRVELDADALARFDLGPGDVAQALQAQSLDQPAGTVEAAERDVLVRFTERRRTPEELGDVVVRAGEGGAEIPVRELGRVVDLFDDPHDAVEVDGQRAGRLVVSKTRNEDSLSISDAVKAFVERERERAPRGVELRTTEDASTVLRGQIDMVVTNGWQGMILVALTLWAFFTFKLAFWVVLGLPVSILGACFFLPPLGLTVNMLSMIGLLLAIGLLMDDAIVIAENVATKRKTMSGMEAAIQGTDQVKVGVFSSFLTTICVLGPLTFLTGNIGQMLRVVPLVLILVMAVSLVEAFWILPGHLGHALHDDPDAKQSRVRRAFDAFFDWLRERVVGRAVDVCLRFRYLFVGAVVALLVVAVGLIAGGRVPFVAMPELEGDTISARVLLPQGTPLERTRDVVDQLLEGLDAMDAEWTPQQPAGEPLVQGASVRFGQNSDAYESGAHLATVSVDLRTAEERTGRVDDYLASWRRATGTVADVVHLGFVGSSSGQDGKPIEVRLVGEDLDELYAASTELTDYLRTFDGVRNLLSDLRVGKPEERLTMLEGARGLGLDARSIADSVSAAVAGRKVDELQLGPEQVEVEVRLAPRDRDDLDDLSGLRIPLPSGGTAPLSSVARLESDRGWARIARVDARRTVTVRGDLDRARGNSAEILATMQREFVPGLLERHPGLELSLDGESANSAETQGSMATLMLVGLLGVFVLLSFQFGSYTEPLVVMAAIPLSLVGVLFGHWLLDFPFTLPSMLGFISLSGVVVNDSILLVEFLRIARREGISVLAAASRASRARFRAVLLTSSTTIAGLLPLLAETSLQAQIVRGLVISVAFGLLAATVLVLVVVPCLYTILGDLGLLADDQAAHDEPQPDPAT